MSAPDVIVLGLGGMGSAAAAHLAARGVRVLGLEQFTPAHALGSSHGDSRVIRQAYFEDPAYVPLLLRSYELYADLEASSPGILTITGGLMVGTASSETVAGSLASAQQHGLPHEMLDADAIRARFPLFAPAEDTVALFEERSGFVRPEQTVREHLRRAEAAGADLRFGERVLGWTATDRGVTVHTSESAYDAGHAGHRGRCLGAVAAGRPRAAAARRAAADALVRADRADRAVAGRAAPGVDLGGDARGAELRLPGVRRGRGRREGDVLPRQPRCRPTPMPSTGRSTTTRWPGCADHLSTRLPTLPGRHLRGVACMYTTTPDQHFVIARHPGHATVTVAAGFSGHGFKFAPVVGEILADLALEGTTRHPISLFNPSRFPHP